MFSSSWNLATVHSLGQSASASYNILLFSAIRHKRLEYSFPHQMHTLQRIKSKHPDTDKVVQLFDDDLNKETAPKAVRLSPAVSTG